MRSCIFYYVVSLSCSVNSLYSMWATWRAWGDKACTHCTAIHSGQLDRLKKKPCEKKSSTMDTEEVHNANSFPNTTDCFHHNEGKQPLLLSSTSTNNTLTKPPNPRFVPRQNLLDRLNAPRVGKKFFQLSSSFAQEKKIIKKGQRKRKKWSLNSQCGFFHSLPDDLFWSDSFALLWHLQKIRFVVRDTSFRNISLQNEKERGVLFFL